MNTVKYPRTPHLPSSLGMTSDDRMASASCLEHLSSGIDLVVTEKMDGGNITLSRDLAHARSTEGLPPWEGRIKKLWSEIRSDIPQGWRISGESVFLRRSVAYDSLPGGFLVFGIWNESNTLLSWDETVEWASLLGLPVVRELYRGNDFKAAVSAWGKVLNDEVSEGFVVRNAGEFPYTHFPKNVAKWVRANHVRTDADWRHRDDYALNGIAS